MHAWIGLSERKWQSKLKHYLRFPKVFRAPELRPKICGAPTLQDKNIGAPGLHDISFGDPGFTVIKYSRAPGIEIIGAPGSKANISGLQGSRDPPSGPCYLSAKTGCSPGKHISPDISLQSGYFCRAVPLGTPDIYPYISFQFRIFRAHLHVLIVHRAVLWHRQRAHVTGDSRMSRGDRECPSLSGFATPISVRLNFVHAPINKRKSQ